METQALSEVLREAARAVEDAELPEALRPTAFERVLDVMVGARPKQEDRQLDRHGTTGRSRSNGAPLEAIASRLGVSVDAVEKVFDADDEGVHLLLGSSALPTSKKAAMQVVARLISAARQAAGYDEEWTPLKLIREACEDRGVLDGPNFSRAITPLDGHGLRIRNKKEAKVNQVGYEKAGTLVSQLAEGSN